MKLDFDRNLDLPVSADRAWSFLDDIKKVASCLPGAAITEQVDLTHYKGTVSVRLGPVNMSFQGTIEILARDAATRTLNLTGKGSDKSGSSVAEMELTASVVSTGETTSRLTGKSTVNVSGKVAAMGARLMGSVSEQLIKDFFANLLKNIDAQPAPAAAAVAQPSQAAPAAQPSLHVVPPPAAPAPAQSINGFAFIWAVIKSFIGGLFSGKKAAP